MKKNTSYVWILISLFILLPLIKPYNAFAQTDIPAGNINGIWTLANSPYHINGEVTIPDSESLTIEPGVNVIFTGSYKFNVQGRLLAVGTRQDTITFTAQDTAIGWHGIRFVNTPATNDTSKIIYCKLQHGKATAGNYYDQSGGAICFWTASPILTNCTISNNNGTTGGGIICWTKANPIVSNNIFANNSAWDGGGIYVGNSSNPLITNNIIVNNHASDNCGGIRCYSNSKPVIMNSVIVKNQSAYGGGIDCRDHADPIVINTIIYWNSADTGNQVLIETIDSDPSFLYCDIEGGKNEFMGSGAGNNYTGSYVNNIESDPLFVDSAKNDFHLTDHSPCIGAGADSAQVSGKWYYAPVQDFEGDPRPNPAGFNPDMGAFESVLGNSSTGINGLTQQLPNRFQLCQNYPNPFNPVTNIQYYLSKQARITLSVYDILGREILVLVNTEKPAGIYQVSFDAGKLASGFYLYRMQAESENGYIFSDIKKLILIK